MTVELASSVPTFLPTDQSSDRKWLAGPLVERGTLGGWEHNHFTTTTDIVKVLDASRISTFLQSTGNMCEQVGYSEDH
jgi:hypothetical protein